MPPQSASAVVALALTGAEKAPATQAGHATLAGAGAASIGARLRGQGLRGHGLWAALGRLTNLGASAVLGVVLARTLAPEDFGRFHVLLSIVTAGGVVAAFGLSGAALRLLAEASLRGPSARRDALAAVLKVMAGAGLVALLVSGPALWVWGPLFLKSPVTWGTAVVVALLVSLRGAQTVLSEVARAYGAAGTANFASGANGGAVLNALMLLALPVAAALWGPTWTVATNATLVVAGVALVACWIGVAAAVRRESNQERPMVGEPPQDTAIPTTLRAVLVCCLPLLLVDVVGCFSEQADALLVGALCEGADVAQYAAARRASMLVRIPYSIGTLALLGMIATLHAQGRRSELQHALGRSAAIAGAPALLLGGFLLLAPSALCGLLFGSSYQAAGPLLAVSVLGQMAFVCAGSCQQVLALTGRSGVALRILAVTTVVQVLATWWGASRFGVVGLAVATSACIALQRVWLWWAARNAGYRSDPLAMFTREGATNANYPVDENGRAEHGASEQ